MAKTEIPNYISRKRAAEIFDTSVTSVDRWCKAGIVSRYRIGGQTKLILEEVLAAVKKIDPPNIKQKKADKL